MTHWQPTEGQTHRPDHRADTTRSVWCADQIIINLHCKWRLCLGVQLCKADICHPPLCPIQPGLRPKHNCFTLVTASAQRIQRKLLVTTEPQRSQTQPGTPLAVHQVDHTQGTCCSAPDQQGTSSNHSRPQPHTVRRVCKASTDPRPQRAINDSRNPALPLLPLSTYHLTHQRHTGTLCTGCANRCNEAAAPQPSTSKTASSWFATAISLTVQGAKLA